MLTYYIKKYKRIMGINSSPPPGLMQPTVSSLPAGASNQRDAAMISQQNMNARQANLNRAVTGGGGGKRRNSKGRSKGSKLNILDWNKAISGGAASPSSSAPTEVVVPQVSLGYKPPGTNPNAVIAQTSSTSMQRTAYSESDNQAMNMKGGNPDWVWGCSSGGNRRKSQRRCKKNTRTSKGKTNRKINRKNKRTIRRR
jgi:hypothetical protein